MKYLDAPIVCNQLNLSLQRLRPFYEGWDFGENDLREGRSGDGALDFCMAENIVPVAYSPLGAGRIARGQWNDEREKKSRRNAASTRGKIRAHAGANRAGVAADASVGNRAAGWQQRSKSYSRSRRCRRFALVARRLVLPFHDGVGKKSAVIAPRDAKKPDAKARPAFLTFSARRRARFYQARGGRVWRRNSQRCRSENRRFLHHRRFCPRR